MLGHTRQNERDDLFRKNKEGDIGARDELFSLNMPLVLSLIKRIYHERDDIDDLFQEGCLGLLKALQGFDPGGEESFTSYAATFIIDEIRYYLWDFGFSERASDFYYEYYIQLHKNQNRMERELKQPPRLKELALKVGLDEEEIPWLLEMHFASAALKDETSRREHPELSADRFLAAKDLGTSLLLKDQLAHLPYRERQFLVSKYLLDKSREEIELFLGISAADISNLERSCMLFDRY